MDPVGNFCKAENRRGVKLAGITGSGSGFTHSSSYKIQSVGDGNVSQVELFLVGGSFV
jgi:hypothetical protein